MPDILRLWHFPFLTLIPSFLAHFGYRGKIAVDRVGDEYETYDIGFLLIDDELIVCAARE